MRAEEHVEHARVDESAALELAGKDRNRYYRQIIDLAHSAAMHLIEAMLARDSVHVQKHSMLPRVLRERGQNDLAGLFEEIEAMRGIRKYGKAGNGEQAERVITILGQIKELCRI